MNIDLDVLFPDGISDETAVVVADVLADLLMWREAHYLAQIRRRTCNPCAVSDPEEEAPSPPCAAPGKPLSRWTARAVFPRNHLGTRPASHPGIGWDVGSKKGRDVTAPSALNLLG